MKSQAGYSKTPLAKKLGFKPGSTVLILRAPDHYFYLFDPFPPDVELSKEGDNKKDLIHFFTRQGDELHAALPGLRAQLKETGMLWVSWPKKKSGIQTDVDEYTVRNLGLKNGLVDIKKCAVDETWSGLKFVIPVKDRVK